MLLSSSITVQAPVILKSCLQVTGTYIFVSLNAFLDNATGCKETLREPVEDS
jgi:hypothetical protein